MEQFWFQVWFTIVFMAIAFILFLIFAPKPSMEKILEMKYGKLNPEIICPQCQTRGYVHAQKIDQNKGISGGKAAGALMTGGLSILAVGISRHEKATQCHCENCKTDWIF